MEAGRAIEVRLGRSRYIGRPAKQLRHRLRDCVDHHISSDARRNLLGVRPRREARNRLLPALGQPARNHALELRRRLRIRLLVLGKARVPLRVQLLALRLDREPVRPRLFRHIKILVLGPAQVLFGLPRRLRSQRLAVGLVCPCLRASVSNHRPHADQRRSRRIRLRRLDRVLDRHQVVAIGHAQHLPVVRLEALRHVLRVAQRSRPVQRDQVVVIQHNQLAQSQRPSQRRRLMRYALHQVAIAAQHIGVVIDHRVPVAVVHRRQMPLRCGHSHRHAESLSQRPGRHLHARRLAALRVPRCLRSPLPELLQLRHRQVVPGQMQRPIQQHRRVPIRQHEPVAVDPLRRRRIVLHQLVIQQIRNRCAAQRRSRMAAPGLFDSVHSQKTQCIDGKLVQFVLLIAHSCPLSLVLIS